MRSVLQGRIPLAASLPLRGTASVMLVVLLVLQGCVLAELAEVGALETELGAGAAGAAEAALVAEAGEAFAVRAAAAGAVELVAGEELAAGVEVRAALATLAERSGLVLASEEGAFAISESRLLLAEDGAVSLSRSAGPPQLVARFTRGLLYEAGPRASPAPFGRLRIVPRTADLRGLSGPASDAAFRRVLRSGTAVDVVQLRNGWFEVRLDPGTTAWVPVEAVLLGVAFLHHELPPPGPWRERISDRDGSGAVPSAVVLRAWDACRDWRCFAFSGDFPQRLRIEFGGPTGGIQADTLLPPRSVRVRWATAHTAAIELRTHWANTWPFKGQVWKWCTIIYLEAAPDWKMVDRTDLDTCGKE
ncbi:MAG: hypothetical protein H3C62_13080 [Gemmatimonadaceae bacterium]|nr:hypothetical protein [Gemmatimonadaceae bacterium]